MQPLNEINPLLLAKVGKAISGIGSAGNLGLTGMFGYQAYKDIKDSKKKDDAPVEAPVQAQPEVPPVAAASSNNYMVPAVAAGLGIAGIGGYLASRAKAKKKKLEEED